MDSEIFTNSSNGNMDTKGTNNSEFAIMAYDEYRYKLGWKTPSGDLMPAWGELPEAIKNAWCCASLKMISAFEASFVYTDGGPRAVIQDGMMTNGGR